MPPRPLQLALPLALATALSACANAPRDHAAHPFYAYDYPEARAALRPSALARPYHENTILDSARLGMAALADGDTREARSALAVAYRLMESGGVNDEARILAATLIHEGVTVWKGEPFEQAMAYTALAIASALEHDWENMRIAARATVRRLWDFAEARGEELTPVQNDDLEGIRFVETDFALGYLLEAIAEAQMGEPVDRPLQAMLEIKPDLAPLAEALRTRDYNTILIVDWGRGPVKERYGDDGSLTRFIPIDQAENAPLYITGAAGDIHPIQNVVRMSRDHRWINLEDARRARSALGTAAMIGGVVVAQSRSDSQTNALIGLGLILAGLLAKATAAADIRHNDFLPAGVYVGLLGVVPGADVEIRIPWTNEVPVTLPGFQPGTAREPRIVYLRLAPTRRPAEFLQSTVLVHSNDVEGPRPGDFPWILGGTCVATPSESVLRVYQQGGFLQNFSVEALEELYHLEGIHFATGPDRAGDRRHADYEHILEGGLALYTPAYGSVGYKRLMHSPHAPYLPKSDRVRQLAAEIASSPHPQLLNPEE